MARADLLPSLRVKVDELRQEQAEMLFSRDDRVVVEASRALEAAYRAGAVLAFLLDGSLDGFFHGMFLAACVRRRFLRAVRGDEVGIVVAQAGDGDDAHGRHATATGAG